jgi:predicted  nucleic acid-binding Zn-ribbon protein
VEQTLAYICAIGGLAGIAAILTVFVNHFKYKRENHLEALQTQLQAMQASFESRLEAMQAESRNNAEAFRAQIQAMQADSKNNAETFRTQNQAMQAGFDSQLKALTESVNSWKGLWEASTQEIRELKMEIKELRNEIDKLRTENAELKGQLKEHYKLA